MEHHEQQPIRDKVSIVLRGPNGRVKDERTIDSVQETARALAEEIIRQQEASDERD